MTYKKKYINLINSCLLASCKPTWSIMKFQQILQSIEHVMFTTELYNFLISLVKEITKVIS